MKPKYYCIRKGRIAETVEIIEGQVVADYGMNGRLLGIEVISPCPLGNLLRKIFDRSNPLPREK